MSVKKLWLISFFDENPDHMESLAKTFTDVVQAGPTGFIVSTKDGIYPQTVFDHIRKHTEFTFILGEYLAGFVPTPVSNAIDETRLSKSRQLIRRTWKQVSGTLTQTWENFKKPEPKEKLGEKADAINSELDKLVGVTEFKQTLLEIEANLKRYVLLDTKSDASHHALMIGNPGTCKTTAARLYARKLKQLGVLSKGHLIEVDRSALVAEFIGQTETKTTQALKSALGGVLYIDEAYSLYSESEKDFGHISIALINKFMEDHRDDIVIVMAGYPREMDSLLEMNSGLRSRFPIKIKFPDYSNSELLHIARDMLEAKGLVPCDDFDPIFDAMINVVRGKNSACFGNGRFVRDTIEALERQLSVRLQAQGLLDRKYSKSESVILKTLTSEDLWAVGERVCGLKPSEVRGIQKPLISVSHLKAV